MCWGSTVLPTTGKKGFLEGNKIQRLALNVRELGSGHRQKQRSEMGCGEESRHGGSPRRAKTAASFAGFAISGKSLEISRSPFSICEMKFFFQSYKCILTF